MSADGQGELVATVSEGQAGQYRQTESAPAMLNHRVDIVTAVSRPQLEAVELAEQKRVLPLEHALVPKLVEHALDPIGMLAYVFEEENAALDARQIGRAGEMSHQRQIAAPERALDLERGDAGNRKFGGVLGAIENAPAVLERELRRLLRAEVVGGQRSREGDHARGGQRGELERGEIAVAQPAFASRCNAREVEAIEQ